MSVVDDYGRYFAHPAILRAACYPLQLDRVCEADVQQMLSECLASDLLVIYNGKQHLQMRKFGQQTRSKSKFPEPTAEEMLSNCTANANQMRSESESESETYAQSGVCVKQSRLHGIPTSPDEVVVFGATLNPKVPPQTCRDFFAHYEGQARTNANGQLFWITGSANETIITNWKAKLPSFGGLKSHGNNRQSGQQVVNGNTGTLNIPSAEKAARYRAIACRGPAPTIPDAIPPESGSPP